MTRLKTGIITALLCSGMLAGWAIWRIQSFLRDTKAAQESHIGNEADSPASISRDEVQEALIALAESQGEPVSWTIADLRAGKIRYIPDNEDGAVPGTWIVNLSERTFSWFLGGGRIFLEISGVFQKDGAKWKAVITGTRRT